MNQMIEVTKRCPVCTETFTDIAGRTGRPRLYCSNRCRSHEYVRRRIGHHLLDVIAEHGPTCYLCGDTVDLDATGDQHAELDHVVPVYLGGTNAIANLRPVHRVCNKRKGQAIQCPNCQHRFNTCQETP